VSNDESRLADVGDDISAVKVLPEPVTPKESLVAQTLLDPFGELLL
jgi:hypothetical protein